MTEHKTFPGKTYCVTCAEGCTVSDSTGALSMECEAGKQLHVTAPSDKLFTSASAIVREVFNLAPAKLKALGLLGGGVSTLPAGYLAAEFLESTGTQYMNTGFRLDNQFVLEFEYKQVEIVKHGSPFGVRLTADRIDIQRHETKDNVTAYYGLNLKGYVFSAPVNSYNKVRFDVPESRVIVNNNVINVSEWAQSITQFDLYLFAENFPQGGTATNPPRASWHDKIRMYRFYFSKDKTYDFVPAITKDGIPCLIDTVNKKELRNAGKGDFVVGFTLEQARKLSKLSSQGGTLAISLPANYTDDAEVVAAIATAEANGWVFEKRTYDAESTASTFALRRILVRRILVRQTQDDNGNYVDADGMRYRVDWCEEVIGAEPEQLGYAGFASFEEALELWGLTEYVDPAEENLLTE